MENNEIMQQTNVAKKALKVSERAEIFLDKIVNDKKFVPDWKKINAVLRSDSMMRGYNIFDDVTCAEDLEALFSSAAAAENGWAPLRKEICKKCGKEFYLMQSEVDWYESKGFSLPKTCKRPECRQKKGEEISQEKNAKEVSKTKNAELKKVNQKNNKKTTNNFGATIGEILRAKGEMLNLEK